MYIAAEFFFARVGAMPEFAGGLDGSLPTATLPPLTLDFDGFSRKHCELNRRKDDTSSVSQGVRVKIEPF